MDNIVITPSPRKSVMVDNNDDERKDIWRSCCFDLDRHACVFFSQFIVLFSIAIFCMYSIATRSTCDAPVFIGLLSTILGIAVPSPTMSKKK